EGRVQVMFNTTRVQQDFDVPAVFRDILPEGSPTHYTIWASTPNLSGTGEASFNPDVHNPLNGEAFLEARIEGSITLFNVLTIPGVSFNAQFMLEVNTFDRPVSLETFQLDPTTGVLLLDSFGEPLLATQTVGRDADTGQEFNLRIVASGDVNISIFSIHGKFI